MSRERFETVMDLVTNCTLPPRVASDAAGPPKAATEGEGSRAAAKTNGRRFKSLTEGPIERRLNQGIPIFVYLQSARDQLDEVLLTLDEALENASNVLTAPGLKELRKWVKSFQGQLDEALAMR